MNKVYLMQLKDKSQSAFVAAPNFNKAKIIFAKHTGTKKYITDRVKGKVLLNENPISTSDYLTTDKDQGIMEELNQNFFRGDRNNLTSLDKKLKGYIDRRIEQKIEEYFDSKIPNFEEEN